MALSDYAHLIVDLDGNPHPPLFQPDEEFGVEVYKNWLYLKGSTPNGAFIAGTVGQVFQGSLRLGLLHIEAKFVDNACLFYVAHRHYTIRDHCTGIVGVAANGYGNAVMVDDDGEHPVWDGITEAHVRQLRAFLLTATVEEETHRNIDFSRALQTNPGDQFFADQFGIDVDGAPVGASQEPMILDLIKGFNPSVKGEDR